MKAMGVREIQTLIRAICSQDVSDYALKVLGFTPATSDNLLSAYFNPESSTENLLRL